MDLIKDVLDSIVEDMRDDVLQPILIRNETLEQTKQPKGEQ